ncbi:MAG: hypothetical protein FD133_625 [Erysipelotrichaceae bacterium]|nr:MAG: hypothetical protein FD179_1242 [Erysipelotrichaceae bacterium]TXT18871.1 MAG: hypothetical protein FD133_625 [Erysipelotrichaceae bacterium]
MEAWIIAFMEQFGYIGVFLMILVENIFPPIPSELILTFGGFMTTTTSLNVPGVVLSATLGAVFGAWLLYELGHFFPVETIEKFVGKYGKILRLKVEDIHRAKSWFDKRGTLAVFVCRMIPVLRSLISIPAGMAKMNRKTFFFYTTIGTLIWNTGLVYAGALLGDNWEEILTFMDVYSYLTYAILGIIGVGLIVYLVTKNRNNKNKSL